MKYARKVIFKFNIRASKYLENFELANIQLVNVLSKIDIFKQCPREIAIVAKGGKPPAFNIFSLQCYQYS